MSNLTTEQKWEELRRHLTEAVKWYREMQDKPEVDRFFYFLREGTTKDILAYMMYLDGVKSEETELLIALLGEK